MSQEEVPCYLSSSSTSLSINPTRIVLPCHTNDADVFCATRIPGRLPRWKQRAKRSSGKEWNLPAAIAHDSRFLASSSGFNRYVGLRGQTDDSTTTNADQAGTETTHVSLSTVASSLSESAPTSSPSLTAATSSSKEPGSTSAPTNATSASNVETTLSITSSSIAPEQTVSTSEIVITAEPSKSSNTIVESSTSPLASSSFSGSQPLVQSTIPPTSTSRPQDTPSNTYIPDPTATVFSSSPQGSSISSTIDSQSTASLSSAWSSSSSSSSSQMDTGGTSSFILPTPGNSVSVPPSSPSSSGSSSFSSTMSEITITAHPPPLSSSVPEDLPSSIISSDIPASADPIITSITISSIPSSLPPITSIEPSSISSSTSIVTPDQSSERSTSGTSRRANPTRTITITKVFTTTYSDGRTTTISTVIETGVLRTDTPQQSNLAHNSGAIAGVAVSVTFAVLLVIFLLFYGCKRYRARQTSRRGSIDILARAHGIWRPPLDGDDDDVSYLRDHGGSDSLNRRQTLGSQGHSAEGGYIGQGGASGSSGDHLSAEGGGPGSAESANIGVASAMHPSFGGQPYMPSMAQNFEAFTRPAPAVLPAYTSNDGHIPEAASQYWWGINDPQAVCGTGGHFDSNEQHVSRIGSRSAVSLTVVGGSGSSGGHGSGSSDNNMRSTKAKRNSISGPRPMQKKEGRRHSSTPPRAFVLAARESAFDCERQGHEQSDRTSVKSFLNRLRTTSHRVSTQSIATLRGAQQTQTHGSEETNVLPVPSGLYSPSLLNPPITLLPDQALLRFPRGVTGNGYASLSPAMPPQMSSAGYDLQPPSFPWPSVTLPSSPSPVLTDDSSMVEGLLHPRLGALANAQQASTASLRDHEDYTRPINGLINNHLRSTTTFDTLGSEDGGPTIAT